MIISNRFTFFMLVASAMACSRENKAPASIVSTPLVEVASVQSIQPPLEVVLPGELKPWNKTQLFAKVKGYVSTVRVDMGTRVRKGETLALLEAPEIIAAWNEAKAQVSAAEAAWVEQQAKHQVSRKTFERIQVTSQTPGAVSANELDVAYSRMLSDSALLRTRQETFHAAKSKLEAQAQLVDYLIIRAPFDGTITTRNISPGELVGPENTNRPLFVLEDRSRLRLTVAIPENLANSIATQTRATFTVPADPSTPHEAILARSSNTLQENNRSMLTEFDFDNVAGEVKSGMYAEVKFQVTRSRKTLFVPKTSVLNSTQGVFVVRVSNDTAEWVHVEKGNSLDTLVEVFGNVHEGERVVRKAYEELRNGQSIRIKS